MAAPGFRPAPYVNLDEFERQLQRQLRSVQQANLGDPLSAHGAKFPPSGQSCFAPNVRRHRTETMAVDTDDQQVFDVDDLREWWKQGSSQGTTESRSRDRKLIVAACALVGIAIFGAVFADKGGAPGALNGQPVVPSADDTARAQNPGGDSASTPADVSTIPPTGLSGATPAAPKVDTQAVFADKGGAPGALNGQPVVPSADDTARAQNPGGDSASTPADVSTIPPTGLSGATPAAPKVDTQAVATMASPAPAQTTDPRPVRTTSVRPDGTQIATQLSAAESSEASSSPDLSKPPARFATEGTNSAVGTAQPSTVLRTKRPGKITTRVVVATTEAAAPIAAADTPIPPLPIGTPLRPEEAGGAKALQPIPESVAAPTTPAEAANQSLNPLMRALGDLVGAPASNAQPPIDPTANVSTGWAVQLAAPKSKAEAKRVLKRLNAKYASALSRLRIVLQKSLINGEAVYGLRVLGLSKSEAEALCSKLKDDGGSCFIVSRTSRKALKLRK